ncbi:MAG: HEAT repeat domain-containing protein [Armatimonadetes bacterium]|nr:HEAT repeat domain-containing protein [Armatimonadota bacterium]
MMDELQGFLEKIKSEDAQIRYAAWRAAGPRGAAAIGPLAELIGSTDRGVAKAAREALQNITHYAARPGAQKEARAASAELLKVAASTAQKAVRAEALNFLGFVGDDRAVPGIRKLLADADVRDEARMALERIPGNASLQALQRAHKSAPEDFKPNLEQSLHNRRLTPATAGIK